MFPHTKNPINHDVPNKEYVLQYTNRRYRCISWHPHYIMTNWVKSKADAIKDGDESVEKFYRSKA